MNAARRKAIAEAVSAIEDAKSKLDSIVEEEQEYFDSMPESLQNSDRGCKAEEDIDNLKEACDNLESAIDTLGVYRVINGLTVETHTDGTVSLRGDVMEFIDIADCAEIAMKLGPDAFRQSRNMEYGFFDKWTKRYQDLQAKLQEARSAVDGDK